MTVIGNMLYSICINCTHPHVVILAPRVEQIHCYVWPTHLAYNSSISTISHIDCSILLGYIANQWLGTFERMHMVLKCSHNFVLIEVRYPMKEGVEVTSRISIEGFTSRIDRHMIVDKLDLILIFFKGIDHIVFLIPIYIDIYP